MTPWTALLESLHSSLIDELNERLPKVKPTLGLPIRQRDMIPPDSHLRTLLACPVKFGSEAGFALLALEPQASDVLKLPVKALWEAIHKRALPEFARRGVLPKFSEIIELVARNGTTALPLGESAPTKIVWIPFSISAGKCYLGIGVP